MIQKHLECDRIFEFRILNFKFTDCIFQFIDKVSHNMFFHMLSPAF